MRRRGHPTKSKSFRLKVDAERWSAKIEGEQDRGTWRDASEAERMTLFAALDRYERERTAKKRGAGREASVLRMLRDEPIARLALARIGGHQVAVMRDEWLDAGYAAATVTRRLAVLSHLYAVAGREWNMRGLDNPVRAVEKPAIDNARDRRVSQDEIEAICAATGSTELAAFIRLAVETAMRRGELCALQWEHVEIKARTAHVPHTKNGHARTVPLSTRAVDVLRALPRRLDGRVFGLRPDSVTQAFERATVRAGIEDVRLHDMRHEAISRLADKLQVHELAKVTGHRDTKMVLRYYHPRAEDLAKKIG